MIIEVDIYQKIRYPYEHEGKSQRAIANVLGISRNTVKKYCNGSQLPWERQGKSGSSLCHHRRNHEIHKRLPCHCQWPLEIPHFGPRKVVN